MADVNTTHLTQKQKQENKIVERVVKIMDGRLGQPNQVASIGQEDLSKFMKFMHFAKVFAASALLAGMLAAVYEYLTLMGVTDVSPARIVLGCAVFFGWLFVWEVLSMNNWKSKVKWGVGILRLAGLPLLAFGLDHWTVRWKISHPPDVVQLHEELTGLTTKVTILTEKQSTSRDIQSNVVKEIQPVPGYLKLKFNYPHLPVDQIGLSVSMNDEYANHGSTYVHDATMKSQIFWVDFAIIPSAQHDDKIEDKLKQALAGIAPTGKDDIAPGAATWSSLDTKPLTQTMYTNLQIGRSRVYYVGHAEWTTNGKPDHADTCVWLQPSSWARPRGGRPFDQKKDEPPWHKC